MASETGVQTGAQGHNGSVARSDDIASAPSQLQSANEEAAIGCTDEPGQVESMGRDESEGFVNVLHDAVNKPSHYRQGKFEAIDVIEDWKLGFCLGNAVKYICRAPHKGTELEDLKKARWYLDRQIATLEKRAA
jgi:hypothetical protein